MRFQRRSIVASLIAILAMAGCTRAADEEEPTEQLATVTPIEGSEVSRVSLAADAADRLGIETSAVERFRGPERDAALLEIPYAAVLYDAEGRAWAYTEPEPLVFVREELVIERIGERSAFLSAGPAVGTEVVTVGAPELLGTEYEVGEE